MFLVPAAREPSANNQSRGAGSPVQCGGGGGGGGSGGGGGAPPQTL